MKKPFKGAIIGHPVLHSLSPVIHNYWLKKHGIEGHYDAQDVAPDDLEGGLAQLIEDGYTGFNITLPYKQAVMKLCATVDETAQAIGAVNTITVGDDGKMAGTNTDWFGFVESITDAVPNFKFPEEPVVILGAGGAARGVVYGLKKRGSTDILICNRTQDTAEALAQEFGITAVPWTSREDVAREAGLTVNTTSLGMIGKPPLLFDATVVPRDSVVCDIVYNPQRTPFLIDAAGHGAKVVEGLGMLLHQARPAFEAWTGIRPEVTDILRERLLWKLAA